MPIQAPESATVTLPFDKFWAWLHAHRNCIVRAGTPDTMLFDHDEYHWDILRDDDTTHVIQLAKGKELVAEMLVIASDIVFVQGTSNESQEHIFECVVETPSARDVAYHFVMAHGFEDDTPDGRRWTH
jgi:hypothetical protein